MYFVGDWRGIPESSWSGGITKEGRRDLRRAMVDAARHAAKVKGQWRQRYLRLEKRIGRPKAVRAVGAANGRNPIPIIVPCHRVIGSHGDLTGFGGGLDTKEALLRLEAEHSQFPNVV